MTPYGLEGDARTIVLFRVNRKGTRVAAAHRKENEEYGENTPTTSKVKEPRGARSYYSKHICIQTYTHTPIVPIQGRRVLRGILIVAYTANISPPLRTATGPILTKTMTEGTV